MYCLENGRDPEQIKRMLALGDQCYFCSAMYEPLFNFEHWTIAENDFPYPNTAFHFLIVAKRHITVIQDQKLQEVIDHADAVSALVEAMKFEYYVLKTRCGDPSKTGGTIEHLHTHLTVSR